ncbi:MAG TPA: two-component sensor histidine kinase, partial [Anaeromyxobacteraceae bacterium]
MSDGSTSSSSEQRAEGPAAAARLVRPAPRAPPVPLPPIARIIPWRHRINTKLLAVTAVIAATGVAVFALAEARMQDQLLEGEAAGAALFSDTIDRATLRAMLENRRADVFETMRDIGRQEGVEGVRLLARDGRIAFSSVEAEVGTVLDNTAEQCRPCHAAGRPRVHAPLLERTRVIDRNGHRVLGLVTPIRNERRCYTAECHAHRPGEDVLGLLDVTLSLASMDARVAGFRRSSLALTAMGV